MQCLKKTHKMQLTACHVTDQHLLTHHLTLQC